jgi:hypothetical protein
MSEISRDFVPFATLRGWWNRERALEAWVALLTVAAVATCVALVSAGYRIEEPVAVAVLCLLALAAEHKSISLAPGLEATIASLVCIFATVEFGPLSGAVVAAVALLGDLPRRDTERPVLRWATWTSIRVLATVGAGLAAQFVLKGMPHDFALLFGAVAAAFAVETLVDITLVGVAPAIRGTSSVSNIVRSGAPSVLFGLPLHIPMVAALVYVYEISPWSVALFAAPAIAAQRLLLLYRQQRESAEALGRANARLEAANMSFAAALIATLDARDRYTAGHSTAVAIYARDIARRMGLSDSEQNLVHLCGLVHDVGKIGLSAGLLEKPGSLSLEERREMELHSIIGEDILQNVDADIASIVRSHHERVDGAGYPDQLEGDAIPLLSRIIAVADAYNAMTSDRPYRDAMPSRVARLRLAQAVGSQFDTSVVAAFEAILAMSSESYRLGSDEEFDLHSAAGTRRPPVNHPRIELAEAAS